MLRVNSENNSKKVNKIFGKKRERKFKCDKCSYAAMSEKTLNEHIKIHKTTKDYQCEHCDFATNTREKLRKDFENILEFGPDYINLVSSLTSGMIWVS